MRNSDYQRAAKNAKSKFSSHTKNRNSNRAETPTDVCDDQNYYICMFVCMYVWMLVCMYKCLFNLATDFDLKTTGTI